MKILIIHEIDWIKKVIFEPHHFAELLSKLGHDVFVIDCPEPDPSNFFKGLHTEVLNNYHRVYDDAKITLIRPSSFRIKGLNRLTNFLTCKSEIKKTILENNINIVLLYGVATNGTQTIKVCQELDIPVVFRALDAAHALVTIPLLKQIAKKCEKMVLSKSSLILTTTKDLSDYVISLGANKIYVNDFPLGVNLDVFKPQDAEQSLLDQLDISNEKIICFMGTLYSFSGISNIIQNFDKLESNFKIKFLIIGGGPSINNLKYLTEKYNLKSKIIFTDFIPQNEIPKYLALSNLCLNPFEINYVTNNIIPTKILEYFACKKPVLSTPLKGTKNMLPNETFGIVYSETKDYVDTIIELLLNDSRLHELKNNGYDYVKENHDWKILSKSLADKFEQLLSLTNKG